MNWARFAFAALIVAGAFAFALEGGCATSKSPYLRVTPKRWRLP